METYLEQSATFAQLVRRTSLKDWDARTMRKAGTLAATKVGSTWLIAPEEVARLVKLFPPEVSNANS